MITRTIPSKIAGLVYQKAKVGSFKYFTIEHLASHKYISGNLRVQERDKFFMARMDEVIQSFEVDWTKSEAELLSNLAGGLGEKLRNAISSAWGNHP